MTSTAICGQDARARAASLASHDRRVAIGAVSWSATSELDISEWVDQGRRLGLLGRNVAWWLGDWLRYGNARYGEKYSRAAKITGYDPQTLMNMAYVAAQVDVSLRRAHLSFSHHAEVAPLTRTAQEQWLRRAETDRLSVRDLRALIRAERSAGATVLAQKRKSSAHTAAPALESGANHRQDGADSRHASPRATPVMCPHCGGQIMTTIPATD